MSKKNTKPEPLDVDLYEAVKRESALRFKAPTSWYRSAWIVKTYKSLGGRYKGAKNASTNDTGLTRWAREQWVNLNAPIYDTAGNLIGYEPCGRSRSRSRSQTRSASTKYPLCRPLLRITEDTPVTVSELSRKEIQRANREKQKIKASGHIRFHVSVKSSSRKLRL